MAFDRNKVIFTETELEMAELADEVLEAATDGIDLNDLNSVGKLLELAKYLFVETGGSREEAANRSLALAMALVRDNVDLTASAESE